MRVCRSLESEYIKTDGFLPVLCEKLGGLCVENGLNAELAEEDAEIAEALIAVGPCLTARAYALMRRRLMVERITAVNLTGHLSYAR